MTFAPLFYPYIAQGINVDLSAKQLAKMLKRPKNKSDRHNSTCVAVHPGDRITLRANLIGSATAYQAQYRTRSH